MGSLAKEFLWKVYGNSAEIPRKVRGRHFFMRQERVRESANRALEIVL